MQIYINRRFLEKLKPERMVLIGIIFWLICFLFSPIRPVEGIPFLSTFYIAVSLLFFWVGTISVRYRKKKSSSIEVNEKVIRKLYKVTFLLGLIGVAFKYYDMFFLREATFVFSEEGEIEVAEGGNIFSILSGMLIYFSYVPVTLDQICKGLHRKRLQIVSIVIFMMTAILAAVTGSRFAIILPFSYFVLLMLYCGRFSFKLTKRNIAIIVFIIAVVGYLVGGLFIARMDLMGLDGADVATRKEAYTRKVPMDKSYAELMNSYKGTVLYTYLFAYSNIVQYETHAIFEFSGMMDNIDKLGDHFYGQATFFVYMKLLYKIIGSDYDLVEDLIKHNNAPGVWGTFFLEWYLDFGWCGILLMTPMGFVSKQVWKCVYMGWVFSLPLLLFISIIWLLVLNLNQISGSGSYAIFSFIMFYLYARKSLPRKKLRIRTLI